MTRKFLQSLGIESDIIDKIMDANGVDIEREKAVADTLREEVKTLKNDVSDAKKELKNAQESASADEDSYKAKYAAEIEAHKQTKADAKKALDDEKNAHTATKTTYETEKLTAAKSSAVLKQLIADGANEKFAKVVAKAFDLSAIELDGDSVKVPLAGTFAFISENFYKGIRLDNAFIQPSDVAQSMLVSGQIGMINNVPLIFAPIGYLPNGVEFIVTNRVAAVAPIKLADYKTHDNPPGINGWLVEGRVYYDAFVLNNKAKAIYVHKSA